MKNLHLIEANKPSRLKKDNSGKLILLDNGLDSPSYTSMNIYITSDEEIKEGDWWYNSITEDNGKSRFKNGIPIEWGETKRIILTNDRDLIRDNIEPIDDTFLQWFVNNPSCEYVEVKLIKDSEDHHELEGGYREDWEYYDVIIPKEELPIVNGSYGCTIQTKIQETIEEASERYANTHQDVSATLGKYLVKAVFQDGAKWQAERMYSEEEVLKLVDGAFHMYASSHRHDAKEWLIEQFKKK